MVDELLSILLVIWSLCMGLLAVLAAAWRIALWRHTERARAQDDELQRLEYLRAGAPYGMNEQGYQRWQRMPAEIHRIYEKGHGK